MVVNIITHYHMPCTSKGTKQLYQAGITLRGKTHTKIGISENPRSREKSLRQSPKNGGYGKNVKMRYNSGNLPASMARSIESNIHNKLIKNGKQFKIKLGGSDREELFDIPSNKATEIIKKEISKATKPGKNKTKKITKC